MNYILNTKTKKVEIYWDNQNEYQTIINFLSQCTLTEEKENQYFIKTNEIPPRTITWTTNNLPNNITIDNTLEGITGITTITNNTAETAKVSLNNDEFSTYVNDSITALETKI